MKKTAIILLCLLGAEGATAQSGGDASIVLGGDPLPAQLKTQYQIVCGSDRVPIKMHTDKGSPSLLTDLIINGKNWVDDPYFAEVKSFVQNLDFPYISAATCPDDQFSFGISGRPRTGTDAMFRVTFPRKLFSQPRR